MAKADYRILISEIARALDDPDAEPGQLRDLLRDCSSALADVVAENRRVRSDAHRQIIEIATMISSQNVTWPEDVARHDALTNEIHRRAELFARG